MKYAIFFLIGFTIALVYGCTVSFQNIDTHGTTSDLVDEAQTASPQGSLNIPDLSMKK